MIALFSVVPLAYRWLALALLALALVAFGWVKGVHHAEAEQALRDKAAMLANESITALWAKRKDNALEKANTTAQVNDAAASILADSVVGLRGELAAERARLPGSSLAACRAYASTANSVFGECAGENARLAKEAAGHAADSLMLQEAWPKTTLPQ